MKLLFTSLLLCALASAQAPAQKAAPTKAATPATPPAATKAAPPAAPKAVGPNLMDPSTLRARAPEEFNVRLTTNKGAILIHVTRAWAPNGADHFYNLVRAGFYNDASFFRVVPGFMVQFGISANPAASKVWSNNNIQDDPVRQSNKPGFVTYAQTSLPNSRSTQLFINYGDNGFLDSMRFAPFGQVIEGMEVATAINAEYREQPDQGRLTAEGKAYVDKNYPRLDRIVSAVVVPIAAPAPAGGTPAADTKK